jgi:hypothetical protein
MSFLNAPKDFPARAPTSITVCGWEHQKQQHFQSNKLSFDHDEKNNREQRVIAVSNIRPEQAESVDI